MDDPANELIHLYEIYDALSQHFVKQEKARKQLHITRSDWKRLGYLANEAPLEQGRHRGKHPMKLRPASPQELEEARAIAKKLIEAFI